MQDYSSYEKGRKPNHRKEARLYHALFYYNEEPDVSDEEKATDSDENTELERAIVSAAIHHGEKGKCGDVESDSDGERNVEGDDDEGRGSIGDESTEQGGARRVPEASRWRLSFPESDEGIGWETDSDAVSEFQLSDIDARNDFLGFEEREDLLESDESEEEISSDRGRGKVTTSRRTRRPRRSRVRRRRGSRGCGSGDSRSRSPLSADEIAVGWSEDNTQPPTHPFTANPGMAVPIPTTLLEFFQLFVPFELFFFLWRRRRIMPIIREWKWASGVHTGGEALV